MSLDTVTISTSKALNGALIYLKNNVNVTITTVIISDLTATESGGFLYAKKDITTSNNANIQF